MQLKKLNLKSVRNLPLPRLSSMIAYLRVKIKDASVRVKEVFLCVIKRRFSLRAAKGHLKDRAMKVDLSTGRLARNVLHKRGGVVTLKVLNRNCAVFFRIFFGPCIACRSEAGKFIIGIHCLVRLEQTNIYFLENKGIIEVVSVLRAIRM